MELFGLFILCVLGHVVNVIHIINTYRHLDQYISFYHHYSPGAPAEEEGQHVERLRPLKDGASEVFGRVSHQVLNIIAVDGAVVAEADEDIPNHDIRHLHNHILKPTGTLSEPGDQDTGSRDQRYMR